MTRTSPVLVFTFPVTWDGMGVGATRSTGGGNMRRSLVLAALVSCSLALGAGLAASPAAADQTVVVQGLSFPPGDTYVTTFGCADLYHGAGAAPLVRLGNLDTSPAGRRSAGVLPRADGSAFGLVARVDSVAAKSVEGFTAGADRGGVGVAWA